MQSIVIGFQGAIFPRATTIGGSEIFRDIVHGFTVCGVSHRTVKEGLDLLDVIKSYNCFIIRYRFTSPFYAESLSMLKKIVTHKASRFIISTSQQAFMQLG